VQTIFALGAMVLGAYAFFFPHLFNERNAELFEGWYEQTRWAALKLQAEQARKPANYFVAKFVGVWFYILSVVLLKSL